jgi:hypothetical protein
LHHHSNYQAAERPKSGLFYGVITRQIHRNSAETVWRRRTSPFIYIFWRGTSRTVLATRWTIERKHRSLSPLWATNITVMWCIHGATSIRSLCCLPRVRSVRVVLWCAIVRKFSSCFSHKVLPHSLHHCHLKSYRCCSSVRDSHCVAPLSHTVHNTGPFFWRSGTKIVHASPHILMTLTRPRVQVDFFRGIMSFSGTFPPKFQNKIPLLPFIAKE